MNHKTTISTLWLQVLILVLQMTPQSALACGNSELRTFIAAAQILNAKSENLGSKLLACPEESAAAAYWLAFYLGKQQRSSKPSILRTKVKINIADPVGRVISQAYSDNYQILKAKLDANDPLYKEIPEASLAVARLLARASQFGQARRYYEDTLRLQDSVDTMTEYLYTYIWEGDLDRAEQEFRSLNDDQELAPALQRGRLLISRLRENNSDYSELYSPLGIIKDPLFSGGISGLAIKNQFRRYGNIFAYHGPLQVNWHHHVIHTQVYDQATLNSDQLNIASKYAISKSLLISAAAHYVVHAPSHWGGQSEIRWQPSRTPGLAMGLDRHHLYADLPLPKTALGLTRDSRWGEITWGHVVAIRSTQHRDFGDRSYFNHELKIRQKLRLHLDLLAQAASESRPNPSLYYASYRQTQSLGLGAAFSRSMNSTWESKLETIYTLKVRQAFGDIHYMRHSGVDARGALSTALDKKTSLSIQLSYAAEETDRPTESIEQRLSGTIVMQFSQ